MARLPRLPSKIMTRKKKRTSMTRKRKKMMRPQPRPQRWPRDGQQKTRTTSRKSMKLGPRMMMRIDYILGQSTAHCATIYTDMGWIRSRMDHFIYLLDNKELFGKKEKNKRGASH
jgi:hypothetical protein